MCYTPSSRACVPHQPARERILSGVSVGHFGEKGAAPQKSQWDLEFEGDVAAGIADANVLEAAQVIDINLVGQIIANER